MKYTIKDIPLNLIESYKNNLITQTDIANEINFSAKTVNRIFKRNNIIRNYENKDKLNKEYNINELSIGDIAKKFNCQTATIKKYLIQLDIINLKNESIRSKTTIYKLDKFNKIETEEEAYWLGFLMADGYIDVKNNRIILSLQQKDRNHIENFAKFIAPTATIKDYESFDKRTNTFTYGSKIKVYSKKICTQLINLGLTPGNKETYIVPDIPENLIRHFIRGYFDGDGTIYVNKSNWNFSICSCNVNLLNFIKEYIEKIILEKMNFKTRDKHLSIISITNRLSINVIMNHLYYDSCIFLERKYNQWYDMYILNDTTDYKRYSLIFAEMQRVREKLPNPGNKPE